EGNVIGIACHVSSKSVMGQNSGVGYATPSNKIKEIVPNLMIGMIIKKEKKPFMGIQASEGAEDIKGASVASVLPNSPAEEAGIQDGDIIIEFEGKKTGNWDDLLNQLKNCKVGQTVKIKVMRKEQREDKETETEVELSLKLGERP
ncbi:MAG: S1C family serine protease, partial [Planctomycetota bacterium]